MGGVENDAAASLDCFFYMYEYLDVLRGFKCGKKCKRVQAAL